MHRLRQDMLAEQLNALSLKALSDAIGHAERKWTSTINIAIGHNDSTAYHDVRIKAKTLRYTIDIDGALCCRR